MYLLFPLLEAAGSVAAFIRLYGSKRRESLEEFKGVLPLSGSNSSRFLLEPLGSSSKVIMLGCMSLLFEASEQLMVPESYCTECPSAEVITNTGLLGLFSDEMEGFGWSWRFDGFIRFGETVAFIGRASMEEKKQRYLKSVHQ